MGSVTHVFNVYKAKCITVFRVEDVETTPIEEAYNRYPDRCYLTTDDIILRVTGVPAGVEAELKGLLEELSTEDLKRVLASAKRVGEGTYTIGFMDLVNALREYFNAAAAIINEAIRRVEGCVGC